MDELAKAVEAERRENRIRCGSLSSSALLVIALPLSICTMVFPWWAGESATVIIDEQAAVTATISLWNLRVTTLVHDVDQGALRGSYTSTWDTACTNGAVTRPRCHAIRVIRALSITMALLELLAMLVGFSAHGLALSQPSFLRLLAAASAALLAATAGCLALLLAAILDTESLLALGTACHAGALLVNFGASSFAVYAASKASPPQKDEAVQIWRHTRLERMGRGRKSRLTRMREVQIESQAAERSDQGWKSKNNAPEDSPRRHKRTKSLQEVLQWPEVHGIDCDIPPKLLEAAFNEIDFDGSGRIDLYELAFALRGCGLDVLPRAIENIVHEMDRNIAGTLDILEFVEFINLVKEVDRNGFRAGMKTAMNTFICRACLGVHILILPFLVLLVTQPDDDDWKRKTALLLLCTFLLFFTYVIVAPLIRMVLGPFLMLWAGECCGALPSCPSCCRRLTELGDAMPMQFRRSAPPAAAGVESPLPWSAAAPAPPVPQAPNSRTVANCFASASSETRSSRRSAMPAAAGVEPPLPWPAAAPAQPVPPARSSRTAANCFAPASSETRSLPAQPVTPAPSSRTAANCFAPASSETRFQPAEMSVQGSQSCTSTLMGSVDMVLTKQSTARTPVKTTSTDQAKEDRLRAVHGWGDSEEASSGAATQPTTMFVTPSHGFARASLMSIDEGEEDRMQALQRLWKDSRGTRIAPPEGEAPPLFSPQWTTLEGYDPTAFREAAMKAMHLPKPHSFSVMHVADLDLMSLNVPKP